MLLDIYGRSFEPLRTSSWWQLLTAMRRKILWCHSINGLKRTFGITGFGNNELKIKTKIHYNVKLSESLVEKFFNVFLNQQFLFNIHFRCFKRRISLQNAVFRQMVMFVYECGLPVLPTLYVDMVTFLVSNTVQCVVLSLVWPIL